jgi:hypothetical protein
VRGWPIVPNAENIKPIDLRDFAEPLAAARTEQTPCVTATSDAQGLPNISVRGSILVFDADHLAFWERSYGSTIANLEANPHIAVLYRSLPRKITIPWRFFGVAEIHRTGDIRGAVRAQIVQEEADHDPADKGFAVLIRIDRVLSGSTVIQARQADTVVVNAHDESVNIRPAVAG